MAAMSGYMPPMPPQLTPCPVAAITPAPAIATAPRLWPVFVGFAILFCGSVAIGIGEGVFLALRDPEISHDPEALVRKITAVLCTPIGVLLTGLPAIIGLSIAIFAGRSSHLGFKARLLLKPFPHPIALPAAATIGILSLGQLLSEAASPLGPEASPSLAILSTVFSTADLTTLIALILVAGLLAGSAEEIFFRGYLQSRLLQRWPVAPAIVTSAAFFGLLHLDLVHSTMAFFLGLFLGYLAYRAGSIIPCVIAHVLNNTVAILLTRAHIDSPPLPTAIVAAMLLSAAFFLIIRLTAPPTPAPAPSMS
jgi:membrane protease YdiL (CAAX protease family)